ncbi:MAG: outer membrane protein assembly factor [Muribaculaceae bacterium]|nr:outer membrane protein assembly factor [Muribaculaceae bacterium]
MRHITLFITLLILSLASSYASSTCPQVARIEESTPGIELSALPTARPDSLVPDTSGFGSIHSAKVPKGIFAKLGFINKIIAYFDEANKPKKNKKFDFSVIGGPHYSTDTKFGVGLVAAGLYRTDSTSTTPQSDVAVYLDATTSMFFKFGLRGTHILPKDRSRFHYDVNFSSVATKFWGIGYDNNVNDDNESKYKYLNSQAELSFVWRLAPSLFIGPIASFDYINARHLQKPELWEGQADRTFNTGLGFTIQYDTRDFLTNAFKGLFLRLDQRFNPRFLGNKYAFSLTELTFDYYHRAWKGATVAFQFHSRLTYGNTPWGLLSTLGGSDNMRGYFEGRYRDKSEIDVCLELRQHVWRRNGLAVWVGAGTVFPKFSAMRWSKVLPNYGIGYRWEFKKRVNVRLDLGFGRHQTGFIFSINEAF